MRPVGLKQARTRKTLYPDYEKVKQRCPAARPRARWRRNPTKTNQLLSYLAGDLLAAMAAVFRAVFGYLFLVFVVRVVGRRPGKQMAPFDYVLIFFLGGLTLTGMVANDRSLTNAFVQIITVALCHFLLTALRRRSNRFAVWMDGTPLVLLRNGQWVEETIRKMNFSRDDILAAMRSNGQRNLHEVHYAVLERSGMITIIPGGEEKGSQ